MHAGTAKVFTGLGGNFIRAISDTDRSYDAMRKLELTVGITTKLNRGHLVHGKEHGFHLDIPPRRRVENLTVLDYPMPRGAVAGYYPELNPLLPPYYYDRISGTPAVKSIPVRVVRKQ
ncbi:molybdopterin-dependent oxidoreductase family protein [Brucella grignonensis]|uniref:Putative oxidoreductase alpha (Molybdopterin) subunit n=1 Tax=Brucella grignonensis TaxID=94627 RepID=A0A256EYH3_9HYPH|nr:hypothetical protein [Brucella grignonensis]OYR07645.1 putative oxidoreductase alpha (Molybdopterin) subunit [Brucella grignonensis]